MTRYSNSPRLILRAHWLNPDRSRLGVYITVSQSATSPSALLRLRSSRSGTIWQSRAGASRSDPSALDQHTSTVICAEPKTDDWPLCIDELTTPGEWTQVDEIDFDTPAAFDAPILLRGLPILVLKPAEIEEANNARSDGKSNDPIVLLCSPTEIEPFPLLQLLESIRSQTFTHWILYIFTQDSLSTESAWHIDAYSQKDSRIRPLCSSNSYDFPLRHPTIRSFDKQIWFCPLLSARPIDPHFCEAAAALTRTSRDQPFFGPQLLRNLDQLTPPFRRVLNGAKRSGFQSLPSYTFQRAFLDHVDSLLPAGFTDLSSVSENWTPHHPTTTPTFPIHFHLDEPSGSTCISFPITASGWCARPDDKTVDAVRLRHGPAQLEAAIGLPRPDVASVFPHSNSARCSGFTFPPFIDLVPDDPRILIEVQCDGYWYLAHTLYILPELAVAAWVFNKSRLAYAHAREARLLASYRARFGPSVTTAATLPPTNIVDVIVPVYLGCRDTQRCIESLYSTQGVDSFEIVVVNDRTPDPSLAAYLEAQAATGRITLISNPTNIGFVGSVNAALSLHASRDVILLNSDTEVSSNWVERLRAAAYGDERIATVSPMTNNGTICSFPRFCDSNDLVFGHSLAEIDQTFAGSATLPVRVPTAVGFCMFIKRTALNQVGELDIETFGLGYGEENDFCLRATGLGFRHVVCPTVFVYHKGSVSFLDSRDARCRQALNSLEWLFPTYSQDVRIFVQADPLRLVRANVQLALLRRRCNQALLFVTHSWGGGVEHHIHDLSSLLCGRIHVLVLHPSTVSSGLALTSLTEPKALMIDGLNFDSMVDLLRTFPITRVHVHHFITFELEALSLPVRLRLPYDITIHDYYAYCPQINLVDHHQRYCGEPAPAACNECLKLRPRPGVSDVLEWRARNAAFLNAAERVFAPTPSVAERISKHFPRCNIIVAPHPEAISPEFDRLPKWQYTSGPLRVAIIGTMNLFKGARLIAETVEHATRYDLPISFHLFGTDQAKLLHPGLKLTISGAYRESELPFLLQQLQPHLIWFTSLTPETYSYTLSAALGESLPIAATDIGAFHDRLRGRSLTWLLPWTTPADQWCRLFLALRTTRPPAARSGSPLKAESTQSFSYAVDYLATEVASVRDIRTPGRLTVAALVSHMANGLPDACAYIRVILPLTHARLAARLDFRRVTLHEALTVRPDILLIQRTVIASPESARRVSQHCRSQGITLVHEIDDALFDIPSSHPEYAHYSQIIDALEILLRNADHIVTSTDKLAERLQRFNSSVSVVPNALDETILPRPRIRPEDPRGPIRILYMGTSTHRADLAQVESALARLRDDFGLRVILEVIGVTPEGASTWFEPVPVPAEIASNYPQFVSWLHRNNRWHIAIAPLIDTPFNQLKSSIKFFDYAAMQLAVVASDVVPYRAAIRNGIDGMIVSNTAEDWYRALRMLISCPSYRRSMAEAAHSQLVAHHTLDATGASILRQWLQISPRRPEHPISTGSSGLFPHTIAHVPQNVR